MFEKFSKLILYSVIVFSIFYANRLHAAVLLISPSDSSVSIGNIISLKVLVNTDNKSINNSEATIQFPVDMLEVVSVTKNSSIFSLWVEEPSFSNITGKITFNGGLPTPGYKGQGGYVATITFKAKKQGSASVIFTDGAVRENDGLGTNILASQNGSVIKIEAPKVEPPKKVEPPEITEEVVPPKPFNPSVVVINNQNVIKFDDGNIISDVDYYIIQIDNNQSFKVKKSELVNDEYYLPPQSPGDHIITITAFSQSGNYTESVLGFVSPAIIAPVLSLSQGEINSGESVIIYGKTEYENKQVNVFLEYNGKEIGVYSQRTGGDGSFSVTTDKIKSVGIVSVSSEIMLSDVIKSPISEKIYLKVNETPVVRLTLSILYPLLSLILVTLVFIILVVFLYVGWHKFFGLRRKMKAGLKDTEDEVHKAMLALKKELNNQLETLEKVKRERSLNEKEEMIFNEIKDNIDGIDSFIEKKLKKLV